MNIDGLISKRDELRNELKQVTMQINSIQSECKHPNAEQVGDPYKDAGSGRTLRDYHCPDCRLNY